MDGELDQCVICHLWRGQTGAEQTCIYRIVLNLFCIFRTWHCILASRCISWFLLLSFHALVFMYFLPIKSHYYALFSNNLSGKKPRSKPTDYFCIIILTWLAQKMWKKNNLKIVEKRLVCYCRTSWNINHKKYIIRYLKKKISRTQRAPVWNIAAVFSGIETEKEKKNCNLCCE